jgi:hypothetical protein
MARRAPPDLPDAAQGRVRGVEAGLLLEGIGGEVDGESVECEGLGGRLDVDLHVAPRAPPERVEDACSAAVGKHLVLVADEALALERVAVALAPRLLRLEQRFLVPDPHARAAAAGEDELGVRGHEHLAVDQQRGLRVCGDLGRAVGWEAGDDRTFRLHDRARGRVAVLHRRQFVRDELAAVGRERVAGAFGDRPRERARGNDCGLETAGRSLREGEARPAPVVERGVEPLPGTDDDVLRLVLAEGRHALGPGLVPGLGRAQPRGVRVRSLLSVAVALHHEAGAVGDLRGGRLRPEAPDERRQQVRARLQERRDVERLEAPEQGVPARRTDPHALAVHVQDEALIAAHVHDEPRRHRRHVDHLAETEDARVALWRAVAGDPRPRPALLQDGLCDRQPAAGLGGRGCSHADGQRDGDESEDAVRS